MTTDRELLEMAVKAYGFGDPEKGRTCWWTESEYPIRSLWNCVVYMDTMELWNPLSDDGDALRLEIYLKLSAMWHPARKGWSIYGVADGYLKTLAFHEDRKRATTMAAAEIGRSMP